MPEANAMSITPVSGALGATVSGVDLLHASAGDWERICAAFLDHLVLFFPDQKLDPRGMVEVGAHFGEPCFYPFIEGVPEAPMVIPLVKEAHERKNFGEGWHTDTTYTECPPKATALYAVDVPTVGGDTMFANMYLAYERLSAGMQAMLAPLRAVHSTAARRDGGRAAGNAYQSVKLKNQDHVLEAIHPLVRTHPQTGRKALYVDELHTARIDGMTDEESRPILQFLYRHQSRPEFTCRHRWSAGTFTVWDNRAAQHYALNDYHGQRREMMRLSIAGDRPG
jgi:taurine dioxygenase